MFNENTLNQRIPIWIALSEFYLDTELEESDFNRIANRIIESPYSFEDVKKKNKYEIFPILQPNLLDVAGEWAGFDEVWLIDSIHKSIEKRNVIKKVIIEISYLFFKSMCKNYWINTEKAYNQIQSNKTNSENKA